MQRYFGIDKINNNLILSSGDIYHIKKVMRNSILDKIEVVYDNVTYLCEIESLDNFKINILEEIREDKKLDCDIILGVALIKEQKQDLVLQKATELGVDTIVPINMERCVVKLDDKKFLKKKERWQSICKEASEQSKRNTIPKILDIKNIDELGSIDCDNKIVLSTKKNKKLLNNYLQNKLSCAKMFIVVGPEGGITDKEEEYLNEIGFESISLGSRIMRAETASIYITRSRRVKRITNEINQIQKDFITICHPEKPVEKNEIRNLIEGSILELREQYTKKEAEMIASAIANSSKKQILFNQYADGWDMLISSIKKQKSSMKVKMIIHNGQEDLTDAIIWNNFDNILGMYDKGLIDEFVFLKKSVYEFYKEKGYRAKLLSKYVEIENRESYNEDNKAEKNENLPIKIGMYEAYDRISRNIYNQLCAVSMIENAKLDCSPVNYKISKIARFFNINLTVANKLMTKQELYKKLANNDINLCVSTVDENNMIPYESLELGTPCLVGNSFKAFEGSSLQDYLVVKNADDILEIKEKTLNALENREKILEEYKLWREKNKQDALKNLKEVLE